MNSNAQYKMTAKDNFWNWKRYRIRPIQIIHHFYNRYKAVETNHILVKSLIQHQYKLQPRNKSYKH